jgi:hypothetical protein
MNIRQRVLVQAPVRQNQEVVGIDAGTIVRHLLLFDSVVLQTVGLRELPYLFRVFGKTGFRDLLESGVLKLTFEFTHIATDVALNGVRRLPPLHFSFGTVDIADREQSLGSSLRSLQGVTGLKNPDRAMAEGLIRKALLRPAPSYGSDLQGQIEDDLRTNSPALKAAVHKELDDLGLTNQPFDFSVRELKPREFRFESDLRGLGLSDGEEHDLFNRSVTAVVNLNQRLMDMSSYSGLSGFADSEAPLLFGKMAGILAPLNPKPLEDQFRRVINIAGLPDPPRVGRVDVGKLLELRGSRECKEFREWLSTASTLSDAEIHEMQASIRGKIGTFFHTGGGKSLRFVVTNLSGLVPGAGVALGPAIGAADAFLIDKIFPNPGVFTFLADGYPSLFK